MDPYLIVWGVLFVLFAILEAATTQLVSIWPAVGSIAALITALAGGSLFLQILLFFAVTIILMLLTRPLVKKFLAIQKTATNADSLIGKQGIVIQDIDNRNASGRILIDGQDWNARTADSTKITKNLPVTVCRMEGVTLIVRPVKDTGESPEKE